MSRTMKTLPQSIQDAVSIDESQLSIEFANFSATYMFWLWNRAEMQTAVNLWSTKLDTEKAQAREVLKKEAEDLSLKMTVDDLKEKIRLQPGVVHAQTQLNFAEAEEKRLAAVCEALRSKKDMLVSLGAHQRAAHELNLND